MITYVHGDYYTSPAQVLVNTVNTVGVMGKGLAKEFRRVYPEMFMEYQELCENGKIKIGTLWIYKTPNKWILNFPTKTHWRYPSKPEYIEAGLRTFVKEYADDRINSIAFPALGCGNGELDFKSVVRPLMEKYLNNLPIPVFVYPHRKNYQIPEHLSPKKMKEWLRSEPEYISFIEVWADVKHILKRKRIFKTLSSQNKFYAEIFSSEKKEGISINKNKYLMHKQDILDFWQQLRRYGFSISKSVPAGLEKNISYLAPIFSELPYIKPVVLFQNGTKNRTRGLQYIEPLAKTKAASQNKLQLSLF